MLLTKQLVSVDEIQKHNGWLHREEVLDRDMYDQSKAEVEGLVGWAPRELSAFHYVRFLLPFKWWQGG